jgi:hypothetical protein
MTFALVLKADGSTDEVAEPPKSANAELDMLQGLVAEGSALDRNYIQVVYLEHGAAGFCHEEAKYAAPGGGPLPRNELGTELLHRAGGMRNDYIAGSFVLVGQADDQGDTTAVPQAMVDAVEHRLSTGQWPTGATV